LKESIKEKFDGNTISGTMTDADLDDYKQYLKLQYINGEIDAEKLEQEITLTDKEKTSLAIARYNKTHGIEDAFDKLNKNESIKEELNIGDRVKIKVATSGLKPRTGTITKKISGDVFEVNIDADNSNMERTDRYYSQDLEKIDSEPIKEDSIEGIVNSLINKYGKEKLQKGLQTPYQKDYVWGLLHREKGLDLTAILDCLKSKLNESIKEISVDEDVDTLEKKMDDVDTTLKDLMDKINGMSEEVEDTEFDIDKANKLIDEALRED